MKESKEYFSHDYHSMSDDKIKELIYEHGMLGYGVYWALVEFLYQNTNVLRLNYERITFELRVDESVIKSVINDFDLFVINGDFFSSNSVQKRLNLRNEKSIKAKESVSYRWNNTNVLRNEYERNTIKEKKRKENNKKITTNVVTKKDTFTPPLEQEVVEFFKEKNFSAELGQRAFSYYSVNDWKDSKGNQVKNWKQKMISVWMKEENKPQTTNNQQINNGTTTKKTRGERLNDEIQRVGNELHAKGYRYGEGYRFGVPIEKDTK